jgi:hypothetical protein
MDRASRSTLTDIRHRAKTLFQKKVNVKESHNRPVVTQRVPGDLGSHIS